MLNIYLEVGIFFSLWISQRRYFYVIYGLKMSFVCYECLKDVFCTFECLKDIFRPFWMSKRCLFYVKKTSFCLASCISIFFISFRMLWLLSLATKTCISDERKGYAHWHRLLSQKIWITNKNRKSQLQFLKRCWLKEFLRLG